ncbi:hypothetical protein GCM10029964_093240 [Kibdelosporangium lantanae]
MVSAVAAARTCSGTDVPAVTVNRHVATGVPGGATVRSHELRASPGISSSLRIPVTCSAPATECSAHGSTARSAV